MFAAILQHVPHWVWALLVALIILGVSQSFPRRRTLRSATVLPLVMIAWSFYGVVSVFPTRPEALAAWATGVAGLLIISKAINAWSTIQWSGSDQRLIVPGSWVPLTFILGLFAVKFGVGIALAMRPELALDAFFAALIGFAYGAFSGVFFGRGVAMWKVARQALQGPLTV